MTLVLIVLVIVWAAVLIPPMIRSTKEKSDPSYRAQEAPDPLERPPVIRNGTTGWLLRFLDSIGGGGCGGGGC